MINATLKIQGRPAWVFGLGLLAMFGASVPAVWAKDIRGTFYGDIKSDPGSLNVITTMESEARDVLYYVYDNLLRRDLNTWEYVPALAEKWTISKDGKTFTFTLRDGLKWHDGQPVTAEDVKYSFDVYSEGRFKAPDKAVYYEKMKEAKIVDAKTIQFVARETYFKNFEVLAELTIIPKHFFGVGDPLDPKFNKEMIGTGPYQFAEWNKGQRIVLKRNPNYWGDKVPDLADAFNFEKINFRIVKEQAVEIELLKKGDLDYILLNSEQYSQKTKGPEWGTKVMAVKTRNDAPANYSYAFLGWNEKHPFFKDRDVRMAMSHLINRDFMIQKFGYGLTEKATGPFGNASPASSPKVKPIEYDPKAALALLTKNGWKMGATGLTKVIEGKETAFEFTLLCPSKDFDKYLTVIKEDMRKVGVTMNIKLIEWNSFLKLVTEEKKFDAMAMSWTVNTLEDDPKQIWHSESAVNGGDNFVSYANPVVDRAIDEMRSSLDPKKRRELLHVIHEQIAADQPYSFFFNRRYWLYAHTARIRKPGGDTLKFGVGLGTWKLQPDGQ